ncbi:MAG: NAD(P)H-dependent oxidoreductase [Candidatus Omnitrophica bacterium]|nr:NAD(P)H-dependent oxidoreductase [Candidatus Omnitrophota bacterium]
MNIAIVYYSYSGNTHKAAQNVAEVLGANNSVNCLRVEAAGESSNFFAQCLKGLAKKKTPIAPIETNLSGYETIIFATPVWAREMVPAMREFLDKAEGLRDKRAAAFVTYGSGFGKEHCLDSMQAFLEKKGAKFIGRFSISQFKVKDKEFIQGLVKENVRL